MLSESIAKLVQYGVETGLIPECERNYTTNLLLDVFYEDDYTASEQEFQNIELEKVLDELLKEAIDRGLIEDSVVYKDLSKPEKDPKAIAAARNVKSGSYPKCLLCPENEGYAGRVNHPARQNHRIIPITINDSPWGFQYSPYVYYNEHCIVFNSCHTPMKIERNTFEKIAKHEDWVKELLEKYPDINAENIQAILQKEVGLVFVHVLEDAGVYKCAPKGREDFMRFVDSL